MKKNEWELPRNAEGGGYKKSRCRGANMEREGLGFFDLRESRE